MATPASMRIISCFVHFGFHRTIEKRMHVQQQQQCTCAVNRCAVHDSCNYLKYIRTE